jgi:hypothetical protein
MMQNRIIKEIPPNDTAGSFSPGKGLTPDKEIWHPINDGPALCQRSIT